MARISIAAAVVAAWALAAGCGGPNEESRGQPVPIVSVTELLAEDRGGLLSVHVDDFRGCPTAFSVKAMETSEEIRLTARPFRGDDHQCAEVPTVPLERPVGKRRIVDATRNLAAITVQGEELRDPCEGQDSCFVGYLGDGPEGRTFLFELAGETG